MCLHFSFIQMHYVVVNSFVINTVVHTPVVLWSWAAFWKQVMESYNLVQLGGVF